jgi:RNA polymerase sigma-70 factor (ECF subfamily)
MAVPGFPSTPPGPAAGTAAALALRIQAGDAAAEAELVDRYSRGVHFLLLDLTRDPARADDLHQETFRLVLEKVRAGELREAEKLPGFIRQLAKNLFIAEYRKRARRGEMDDLESVSPPADTAPDQLSRVLRQEDARLVRQLLAELHPERDRVVLFRFYLASEPKERICADLGLNDNLFNVILHRARQRFKALIEKSAVAARPWR